VLLAPAGFGRIAVADAISLPGVRHVARAVLPLMLSNQHAIRLAYTAMVGNGVAPERDLVERVVTRGAALAAGAREATRAVVEGTRSNESFHRRRLSYDGPVYAVWGDRDRLVPPAHAGGLQSALPQARIEIWPGMGHDPMRERRDDVIALVAGVTRPRSARGAERHAA
jgi:pimeloyl-ACP methyl ester carboxylesterase